VQLTQHLSDNVPLSNNSANFLTSSPLLLLNNFLEYPFLLPSQKFLLCWRLRQLKNKCFVFACVSVYEPCCLRQSAHPYNAEFSLTSLCYTLMLKSITF